MNEPMALPEAQDHLEPRLTLGKVLGRCSSKDSVYLLLLSRTSLEICQDCRAFVRVLFSIGQTWWEGKNSKVAVAVTDMCSTCETNWLLIG